MLSKAKALNGLIRFLAMSKRFLSCCKVVKLCDEMLVNLASLQDLCACDVVLFFLSRLKTGDSSFAEFEKQFGKGEANTA